MFARAQDEGGLVSAEEERRQKREAAKAKAEEERRDADAGPRTFTGAQIMSMSDAGKQKIVDQMNAALDLHG